MFFKEIPKWYYILSYCFQCNIFKIVFRCIFKLTSVCQNSVSDSNTKTVLLSEAVFFKKYSNGSTFKSNVFKVIFAVASAAAAVAAAAAAAAAVGISDPTMLLLFKTVIEKVIPKWY